MQKKEVLGNDYIPELDQYTPSKKRQLLILKINLYS